MARADAPEGEQQELEETKRRGRGAGRRDSTGTPETVKILPLKAECPRLLKMLRKAKKQMEDYRENLNDVCEANGANSAVVNRLLNASLKGNYETVRQKAEQQAIVFDGVGEVSDSGE